ncbi:hypothetical protein Brms1b_009033 [Colletotrichum noveboracense]|nr:hypothetical protein Brms1b_009033 [Colletotrichum noveboracense]
MTSAAGCSASSFKNLAFGTLTKGTNHDLVMRRYLDFHGISETSNITYYDSFYDAVAALKNDTLDYVMMNAVHPQASSIVGSDFRNVFIIDTFISPSKPLVVATRKDVADPQSIGILCPSVAKYTDTSKWSDVVQITSGGLVQIAQDLLNGKYDSAIIYQDTALANSDVLQIDEELGSPDDAWLLLGRNRTYTNSVLAWPNAPVTWQWKKQWEDRGVLGDVHLTFGSDQRVFSTAPTSTFDITTLAWFSDVTHEVKELTSGYRLALTYNIVQNGPAKQSAGFFGQQAQEVKQVLLQWQVHHPNNDLLVYPLDHKYSKSSLSLRNMKGRDKAVCQAIQDVGAQSGVFLLLAHQTHTTTEDEDDYYDNDAENGTCLDAIFTGEGKEIATDYTLDDDEVMVPKLFEDRSPDSEEEGEFTGNEGAPSTYR